LRCILRHCGVRQVRLIPQALRALPAELLTKPSIMAYLSIMRVYQNLIILKGDE
jgi:hypothetical protein